MAPKSHASIVAEIVGVHGLEVVAAALARAIDEANGSKRQDTFGASELFYTKKNGKPTELYLRWRAFVLCPASCRERDSHVWAGSALTAEIRLSRQEEFLWL
jgi:hypothetical protein